MPDSTQAHLYWLSCNRCSMRYLPLQAGKRMFMSSCGCIYCMRCVQASTQAGCVTCNAGPGKVLPIGKNFPQQVVEMFNRNEESLSKINKRSSFQNLHFNRCLKLLAGMERTLTDQVRAEEREVKLRLQEMKMLEDKIREKQSKVDKLEAAMNSMNISNSPVHTDFFTSLPAGRQRSGRERGATGPGLGLSGGERLF